MNHPTTNPYAAGASTPPAAQPPGTPQRPWRWLRGLALLVLALLAGLWWWSGSSSSLATVLAEVAKRLPPEQQLELRGVSGTLRAGGHIDWLRWSSPDLTVELHDTRLGWRLAPLLQGRLRLEPLQAAQLTITPAQASTPTPAPTPLQQLVLPLPLALPFRIDRLTWNGPSPVAITNLTGSYRYDDQAHQLDIDRVTLAQGQYQLQARLLAHAPMQLQAHASGTVHTEVPGSSTPMALQAQATLQGTLAGSGALLHATAQLHGALDAATAAPVRADLQAQITPWAAQPLQQASATLQALNLAALWPQAPRTQLRGSAQLEPQAGTGWHIAAQLRNALPGPWDRQQLPISALQASAQYDGAQWQLPKARIEVGPGSVELQGSYTPASHALQGRVQLQQLDPALLHSRLAAAPLNGTASARSDTTDGSTHSSGNGSGTVRFDVALRAARVPGTPARTTRVPHAPALRLDRLDAQGGWQGRQIDIAHLQLDALQAQLRARDLHLRLDTHAASGTLQLQIPGAHADVQGSLAPRTGGGNLHVQLQQAQATQRWLASLGDWLPLPTALQTWQLAGDAQLQARWHGGWQALEQPSRQANGTAHPPPADSGNDFAVQATLTSTRLQLSPPADGSGAPTTLQRTSATLQASQAQATLALSTTLRHGTAQVQADTRASATSQGAGRWRARLEALQLRATLPSQHTPWVAQLAAPIGIALERQPRLQLQADAGTLRLTGPTAGAALLHWQPLQLAQADGRTTLRSQGTLTDLPLAWANTVARHGQPLLGSLGLGGDLRLAGAWDIDTSAATPRLQAHLERSAGDLQLLLDDADASPKRAAPGANRANTPAPGDTTPAGLREARLQLRLDGATLHASLHWNSTHLGTLQAQASTQLTGTPAGDWAWPQDAPLNASVHATLPALGVWSTLAPPGWRVRGTLAADMRLAGTRAAPQWSGTLAADDFAVRSLLDGVDLQNGQLRATLRGQQLSIDTLTLHGGRGSGARIAGYSGNRSAAPTDGGSLHASGDIAWSMVDGAPAIRMNLQAQLQALQLLVRADRQLSVSGALQAQFGDGQLALHGNLTTDRATIVLPEAGTPTLGSDVVVHRSAATQTDAISNNAPATTQSAPRKPPMVDLRLNLGDDFAVQGYGLTTRLQGQLTLHSQAGTPLQVRGEVRTDAGRYRAWGQMLDVETGLLRFSGRYDNPQLDILALRPNISVRAGVQVSGTAQAPRVLLYAEPDMPDAEKLSWVVLGKNASGGGAEAALMQQAALALLGSKGAPGDGIARSLGLDEVGFKGPQAGQDASSAALTLGKRLSKDLYVSYERSLSGVTGTLFIFYDLSRHLTLRGQTGEQSALDLVYTVRYN